MDVETEAQVPAGVTIHREPRRPVEDPTLGVPVAVDRSTRPANRLVTIGDSLTQGFMSAAIFRTDLSWPAVVAHELGLRPGTGFRYPVFEPPTGPGGLPFDLERFVRGLEAKTGDRLDWYETIRALRFARSYMDRVEDWWERGPGNEVPESSAPYHNLAVYGADILDVLLLDAERIADRLKGPSHDDPLIQIVDRDNDRAWRHVLESCREPDGTPRTVVDAARAMGDEGSEDGGAGSGIETLVVMLGGNHALGAVVDLKAHWTPDDYLDDPPEARLDTKGPFNVWQPAHFAAEWALLVDQLERIDARHVVIATIPQVTIAPIARGSGGKVAPTSRYFRYYVRPWISDEDFDRKRDAHLTADDARAIDSAIDDYNATIIESVRAARRAGRDWYVFELGGLLDRLATRRYREQPAAQPPWWTPYPLPAELAALDPEPNTRFFRSGPNGRTAGGFFSLDGVHPTTIGYGLVAHEMTRLLSGHAQVPFFTPAGTPRPPGTVGVDFARVLASDTLVSRPPRSLDPTLGLIGWLDEALDWANRLLPFR
jgi:hypothetical protein